MKTSIVKLSLLGALALVTSSISFAAPLTDVQDFSNNTPTEYFVSNDSQKTNLPYYRRQAQDWTWIHGGIAGTFSSIKLDISAFDVDYSPSPSGEHDVISVWDGSSWFNIGELAGNNNIWAFTNFDLTAYSWAQAQVNAGLKVHIDIDSTNTGSWAVTLGKATLSVDGGSQQCVPTPGIPCTPTRVPEPSALMLLGLGLLSLAFVRRRTAK